MSIIKLSKWKFKTWIDFVVSSNVTEIDTLIFQSETTHHFEFNWRIIIRLMFNSHCCCFSSLGSSKNLHVHEDRKVKTSNLGKIQHSDVIKLGVQTTTTTNVFHQNFTHKYSIFFALIIPESTDWENIFNFINLCSSTYTASNRNCLMNGKLLWNDYFLIFFSNDLLFLLFSFWMAVGAEWKYVERKITTENNLSHCEQNEIHTRASMELDGKRRNRKRRWKKVSFKWKSMEKRSSKRAIEWNGTQEIKMNSMTLKICEKFILRKKKICIRKPSIWQICQFEFVCTGIYTWSKIQKVKWILFIFRLNNPCTTM